MVMELRGIAREEAIKALHLDKSPDGVEVCETKHSAGSGKRRMTAKEFFGDLDYDGELMTAKDFFSL